MMFYYSLKSIPELTKLPALMRWRVWFACVHKTFLHWQTWLACAAAEAPILVFFALFIWLVRSFSLAISNQPRGSQLSRVPGGGELMSL